MKTLVIITGPTAVGKTDLSIELALRWKTDIISCDSRQIYREMKIGTAVPDEQQLKRVKHHFIGSVSIHQYYSAFRYEQDALKLLHNLFSEKDIAVMTGGSGLYMDAILNGLDEMPDADPAIREELKKKLSEQGLTPLLQQLEILDPAYFQRVDQKNPARIIRGLEVCLSTGKTFTEFRKKKEVTRDFQILLIGLELPRSTLYEKIERRVDAMMDAGLLEEAKALLPYRSLPALNTVGYRECFGFLDGQFDLTEAIRLIKRNTRHYARRQITWNNRYPDIRFYNPSEPEGIVAYCESKF